MKIINYVWQVFNKGYCEVSLIDSAIMMIVILLLVAVGITMCAIFADFYDTKIK